MSHLLAFACVGTLLLLVLAAVGLLLWRLKRVVAEGDQGAGAVRAGAFASVSLSASEDFTLRFEAPAPAVLWAEVDLDLTGGDPEDRLRVELSLAEEAAPTTFSMGEGAGSPLVHGVAALATRGWAGPQSGFLRSTLALAQLPAGPGEVRGSVEPGPGVAIRRLVIFASAVDPLAAGPALRSPRP